MKRRALIYDLDGTLADTRRDIVRAANHMRERMGLAPLPDEAVRRAVGMGLKALVRRCLETEEDRHLQAGMRLYREFYEAHLLDHTRLYPSARAVLERFRGRVQAVVTNKPEVYSRRVLEGLGVAGFFERVVGGDSGHPKKPDPAAVRALLEEKEIGPEAAVLIGDSPIDAVTARAAGIESVCVTHGFSEEAELLAARPDRLVPDLAALLRLADEERW